MNQLGFQLVSFGDRLSEAENANYKLLLALACGGLMTDKREGAASLALDATMNSLANLQKYNRRLGTNGVVWRGRPAFMSDALLQSLQAESSRSRSAAARVQDHYVATGGSVAKQLGASSELQRLVQEHAGGALPTGAANYLYYDEPDTGIDPHVDNEEFPLNTILMLEHSYVSQPSALILYPNHQETARIILEPGELIIFFADSVVHARERMKANETLRIASFGFQPA